ncbi:MAG: flagellar basal body rod C-terminal domain-containing protein [Rhizomicrobium sp.]
MRPRRRRAAILSPQDRDGEERVRPRTQRDAGPLPASRWPTIPISACNTIRQPERRRQGLRQLPNVNALVEIMDMREAQRSYEADLTVMDATKAMLTRTVDLLRK